MPSYSFLLPVLCAPRYLCALSTALQTNRRWISQAPWVMPGGERSWVGRREWWEERMEEWDAQGGIAKKMTKGELRQGSNRGSIVSVCECVCLRVCVCVCVKCLRDWTAERMSSLVLSVYFISLPGKYTQLHLGTSHLGVMSNILVHVCIQYISVCTLFSILLYLFAYSNLELHAYEVVY